MTDREQLRKEITDKFRTLSNFSDTTGIPYKKVMRILNSDKVDKEGVKELRKTCRETEENKPGLILEDDRKEIRMCILLNFKDYTAFCNENNDYDSVYLSNIIGGRLIEETSKYKELVKLLTDKYSLNKEIWKRINT